jgi:hypothetical protein
MPINEASLLEIVDELIKITRHKVSPDAYATILKVLYNVVNCVYARSIKPHKAELIDLKTAIDIITPRQRPEAHYGLMFLRLALTFKEEEYSQPILTQGGEVTLKMLIDAINNAVATYSTRYTPPTQSSFDNYKAYYDHLNLNEIINEVTTPLSNVISVNQLLARFERLLDISCNEEALPYDDRYRAAKFAGIHVHQIRQELPKDVVDRFNLASRANVDNLVNFSIFQDMARRLRAGEFFEII